MVSLLMDANARRRVDGHASMHNEIIRCDRLLRQAIAEGELTGQPELMMPLTMAQSAVHVAVSLVRAGEEVDAATLASAARAINSMLAVP
jgi:hypothetical protein